MDTSTRLNASEDVVSDVKYCVACGVLLCKRLLNPLQIPFSVCHHCGATLAVSRRPTQSMATQTPAEWKAFASEEQRTASLEAVLQEFADKARATLLSADMRIDLDHNLSFSPRTARDKLRELVATHEDVLLQLKRVHDAEVRSQSGRLVAAECLNAELTKHVSRLEEALQSAQSTVAEYEFKYATVRQNAFDEAERKWKMIIDSDSANRKCREDEVFAAWKILYKSLMDS